MDRRTNGLTDTDGHTDGYTVGQTDRQTDGQDIINAY